MIFHHDFSHQKRAGMDILISEKIVLKLKEKKVTREKESNYILIKGSSRQCRDQSPKLYKVNPEKNGERRRSAVIVGDLNTTLLIMTITSSIKNN